MSPFCQKVDSQNQLRLPLFVALIWLIMIFSWLNFFSLTEQRKEAKETRLAGAYDRQENIPVFVAGGARPCAPGFIQPLRLKS